MVERQTVGRQMVKNTIELPGEELNRRLEDLSMKIERVSILIEDAMVDPNDVIGLDSMAYNNLMICLAKYEEFLDHLHETTLDTTDDIRELVGCPAECYGVVDEDRDEDQFVEDEDQQE
ncbi:hypothetical protein [Methanocella arvoryzae]|uniref:Uncharacterized protein n=1 Tax=Methanocella arvoryzae (strain DSM 22066 / NBRC 105507 / MRE50) TaxID=351160 RepID=Q0W227_METAR|nr:hypothetical protein [Methanocella arvoryzae]CAJ37566.1 hypothetical protein RCIX2496 [Methanocella arvoryzae MRE50]